MQSEIKFPYNLLQPIDKGSDHVTYAVVMAGV